MFLRADLIGITLRGGMFEYGDVFNALLSMRTQCEGTRHINTCNIINLLLQILLKHLGTFVFNTLST